MDILSTVVKTAAQYCAEVARYQPKRYASFRTNLLDKSL